MQVIEAGSLQNRYSPMKVTFKVEFSFYSISITIEIETT